MRLKVRRTVHNLKVTKMVLKEEVLGLQIHVMMKKKMARWRHLKCWLKNLQGRLWCLCRSKKWWLHSKNQWWRKTPWILCCPWTSKVWNLKRWLRWDLSQWLRSPFPASKKCWVTRKVMATGQLPSCQCLSDSSSRNFPTKCCHQTRSSSALCSRSSFLRTFSMIANRNGNWLLKRLSFTWQRIRFQCRSSSTNCQTTSERLSYLKN